jgi:hypothetical protein
MENFDLRKYLAENKLLKELNMVDFHNHIEREAFMAGWANHKENENAEDAKMLIKNIKMERLLLLKKNQNLMLKVVNQILIDPLIFKVK